MRKISAFELGFHTKQAENPLSVDPVKSFFKKLTDKHEVAKANRPPFKLNVGSTPAGRNASGTELALAGKG